MHRIPLADRHPGNRGDSGSGGNGRRWQRAGSRLLAYGVICQRPPTSAQPGTASGRDYCPGVREGDPEAR